MEINQDSPIPQQVLPPKFAIAYYYSWYGNPQHNKDWLHWNHQILVDGPPKKYTPPDSIGANFYPLLGTYSSTDPEIIEIHMNQLKRAKISIICLSWWGEKNSDQQLTNDNGYTDTTVSLLLDAAQKHGIYVCFHHEPYSGRSADSFVEDLKYLIKRYGQHPAFFRYKNEKPLIFVYDAYLTKHDQWARALKSDGDISIRGKAWDAAVISLFVDQNDRTLASMGGFDGVYTYFATDGFTMGSTTRLWNELSAWAQKENLLWIPCVGPGYDDTRIRPWNEKNKRSREEGKYYENMWNAAIQSGADIVGITSFNEWHEGTQIEPAVPKGIEGYEYSNYLPLEPEKYLDMTANFVVKLNKE